jgi:phospholipid transport system transporter-binding protein
MKALSGELTQRSVPGLMADAAHLAAAGTLDLSAVTRIDSAGLALLLDLIRQGRRSGVPVIFSGAPPQVVGLAHFFTVAPLLGLE